MNTEELIKQLFEDGYHDSAKALKRKNDDFYHSEEQLDDHCQNLEIFRSYVASVGNGLEIGIKSAILYAKVANITLCIWQKNTQKNTKNAYELELLEFHEADSPATAKAMHLFQFDNSIDFKLLTVADSKNAIEFSQQENEQNQSSFQLLVESINNDVDVIDNNNHNYNNSANSQPSQISRAYSWFSRLWNRHEIPTKVLSKPASNHLGWINFVTSFTEGARWVCDLLPPVLLGLLAHDYIVYWDQPENRYGATWDNILLGNAPNELSWASQFGSYFPTEFNYWLLPFLLPTTMLTAGIFKAIWNYSRSRPLEPDDFYRFNEERITSLRDYARIDSLIDSFNDTFWWHPLSHHVNLLSRLEFLLLHDTGLKDDERAIIFKDIQLLAKDYHSLARLNTMSSLANIANSNKGENEAALLKLQDQAKQGNYYAKYLLWTLGKTQNTSKLNALGNVALHSLFWVASLSFSLRLSASLGFKFRDWIKYKENQAACETNSKGANSNYTWALVPEIADYQCLISTCNSPDVYYLYRSNVQECLNAFLSKPHSADEINTFVKNLPGAFDSVSFRNQSWYTWSPDDLKLVLDAFANRFPILKMFDLSIDQYKEITIDNGIIDVLTNFFQKVGIWQIDIHNLGIGADPVNKILLAINGSITDWLDLSGTDSDDSVAGTLKSIMPHTFFKVIKAAGNYFTDNGIGDIAQGAENSTLANLDVSYNPYGPAGWKFLSDSLPKTQLNTLTARGVDSSQADFGSVGRAIAQTPTLETFNIPDTNINDRQAEEFSAEAKSSRLKSWDLSGTGVTGEGASNAIRNFKNSTLEEINLSKLRIQGKDFKGISEGLSESNIRRLRISGIGISPDDFCQFTASLNQTSVDTLDAGKNGIKDQGAICLGDAIADPNGKLQNVQIPSNGISEKGGMKMMQAVADSNRVSLLDMSKNSFAGLNGASAGNMLQQNQQLEVVILDETNIGPEVGDAIADKLSKAKQLKQLSLNNNPNLGNAANKKIAQNLIKPIANMNKLGSKLSNDPLRDLHHAKNQTQIDYLGVENTSLQNDGAREFCQVWPVTHNALDQLQAGNNLVNEVNMENCQTSEASKLSFGSFGKYFTAGYISYNLFNYFFTDHREWTLDDNDRKQIEQYKTKLAYLKNQHKPQIASVATKNPNLNYLFEKVADLCYAVTAILTGVEKTKELSDTILEAVKERLTAIEKNIQKISQYNKEMRSKHNKVRRQRFEKRCKRTEESGVVIIRRNVLTGKVTQRFFVAADAKTTEFLTANKQTLVAERKTKSMRFTEMQQFWQLQRKAEGLLIDLKKLAPEDNNVIASAAKQSRIIDCFPNLE